MKKALPFFLALLTLSLFAQDYPTVSYSSSYAEHAFYRLSDNATTNIDNNSWDMALSISGTGIFINETSIVFGSQNVLYQAPTDNFDDVIDPADLTGRLLNDEVSWDYGAFNAPRDESNPNDTGWGIYDPMTETYTGDRVFALQFKDGTYQKIQIVSLEQGVYAVKYADLDGSNETTTTVDKANFPNSQFAFLSFKTNQALDVIPDDWDLLFTRYSTPVDDGAGGLFDLVVAGVLSAPGVQVAEARGIDPEMVEYSEYVDSLGTATDEIGYDWKEFDNVNWILATDLAYFVKIPTGQVWKIIFLTFDGSSTGDVLFEKTTIIANATKENSSTIENFAVSPNPLDESSAAVFSLAQSGTVNIMLSNMFGQQLWSGKHQATTGLNAVQLPAFDIPSGTYVLSLEMEGEIISKKVVR